MEAVHVSHGIREPILTGLIGVVKEETRNGHSPKLEIHVRGGTPVAKQPSMDSIGAQVGCQPTRRASPKEYRIRLSESMVLDEVF